MKEGRDNLEETLATKRDNNCFLLNQIFMKLGFDCPWFLTIHGETIFESCLRHRSNSGNCSLYKNNCSLELEGTWVIVVLEDISQGEGIMV
jgi:hypothetical protein